MEYEINSQPEPDFDRSDNGGDGNIIEPDSPELQRHESEQNDWRIELKEWLKGNNYQKTIPQELLELREEFVRRFPKEKLMDLTLKQYALGHEDTDNSFCNWLEYKTKWLGGIGGNTSRKHGVWYSKKDKAWRWDKMYKNQDDALSNIKEGLAALIEAVKEKRFDDLDGTGIKQHGTGRNLIRGKTLSLYFPEEFTSIAQKKHLEHFLTCFGETVQGESLVRNRQLLQHLRDQPEFDGFDTHQMMNFLYQRFPPPKENQVSTAKPPPTPISRKQESPLKLSV